MSAVERDGDALVVVLGGGERLPADMVVHGAGRVPALDALDLAAGRRGLRPPRESRWTSACAASPTRACGPSGTRRAEVCRSRRSPRSRARVAAATSSAARPGVRPGVTPSVTFTDPPLAAVGLTEEQAAPRASRSRGVSSTRRAGPARGAPAPRSPGPRCSWTRAPDASSARTCSGHHAEDVINVFALAMTAGLTVQDLMALPWAYPTAGGRSGIWSETGASLSRTCRPAAGCYAAGGDGR